MLVYTYSLFPGKEGTLNKDEFDRKWQGLAQDIDRSEFLYNHGVQEYFQKVMALIKDLADSTPPSQWWTKVEDSTWYSRIEEGHLSFPSPNL